MLVTRLEYLDKKKVKVYIDDEYSFLLYIPDIKKNKIEENTELTEEQYKDIVINTVFRRAKQKALAVLKHMDRTEFELREKLKRADYTDNIIDKTIDYIKGFNYIDDEKYCKYYIRNKKTSKSKRIITMELIHKGVSKDIIEEIMNEEFVNDDMALTKAIGRKMLILEEMRNEDKLKLVASLYRKGFQSEDIKKYIKY